MKQLYNKLKSYLSNETIMTLMMLLVLIQPIIDLDYLLYPTLDPIGIPLPSTVVFFIGMPLVFALAFLLKETSKKKVFLFTSLYLGVVGIYFVIHHLMVKDMFELLYLTNRYDYTLTTELRYVLTMIIPLGLVYAFFKTEFTQKVFDRIVIITSLLISVPLFFSNLFLFGPSTYYDGPTLANFPYWFFGIYDDINPKQLATKFFFSEGNTTGIILFSIYPLIINIFFKAKKKLPYLALIIIQGWAMYVLATRVATYGVPLMIAATTGIWIFQILMKKEKFQWKPLVMIGLVFLMFYSSLSYTPAVVNLQIDYRNNSAVWDDEYIRLQAKDELEGENLIPGTAQFNYYYENIFKNYAWLLTLPDVYYKWYYPYKIDPKFYVDLIFEVEFADRTSGRQFERIFFDYKWAKLSDLQKLFGFGYSRFMMGSILLEQDFIMQAYTLGYVGTVLLTGPWLILLGIIILKGLRKFKYACTMDILTLGVAIVAMFGGAYLSGHILDQFFSSTYLALYIGFMFTKLKSLGLE